MTHLPFNPALEGLAVYQPGRPIEEVARELGLPVDDIIKLASNENPLGPSPAALAAMEKTLKTLHLYPDGNAYYLKRALAARLALDPRQVILGNGSNEIIEFVGHALLEPGAEVVVSQYCFLVYPIITQLFKGKLVTVPARNFGHDLEAMRRAITAQTRVIFVASPNNPTGTVVPSKEIEEFIDAVPPEILVAIDEAYVEFLDQPADLLPRLRAGRQSNLLLMRTFSKIYGLAGLRLGYGLGHADLIAALEKVRQPFNTNALVQAGAIAALGDTEHIQRTRQNNAAGLRFYEEGFRRLKLEWVPSSANFILVRVGDGSRICAALQEQGVIVRPMGGYALPEWIRISIGTPAENQRCLAVLQGVLAA
ncbi:MAG TPA: histidinol-phosphate transaminase [Verrucomicrobiae bacterium]|nr:histidinol-phosphate transaminase [Verrucomicrobiae bacterium]